MLLPSLRCPKSIDGFTLQLCRSASLEARRPSFWERYLMVLSPMREFEPHSSPNAAKSNFNLSLIPLLLADIRALVFRARLLWSGILDNHMVVSDAHPCFRRVHNHSPLQAWVWHGESDTTRHDWPTSGAGGSRSAGSQQLHNTGCIDELGPKV